MAATSASPSDRGNAWMKQLMAAVGPEANRQRGLRPVMKTQILRLRHSRSTRGGIRFPVDLPNSHTPLEWTLAAAASSLSWPVADNVR